MGLPPPPATAVAATSISAVPTLAAIALTAATSSPVAAECVSRVAPRRTARAGPRFLARSLLLLVGFDGASPLGRRRVGDDEEGVASVVSSSARGVNVGVFVVVVAIFVSRFARTGFGFVATPYDDVEE